MTKGTKINDYDQVERNFLFTDLRFSFNYWYLRGKCLV